MVIVKEEPPAVLFYFGTQSLLAKSKKEKMMLLSFQFNGKRRATPALSEISVSYESRKKFTRTSLYEIACKKNVEPWGETVLKWALEER